MLVAVAAGLVVARVLTSRRPGWATALAQAPAWLLLVVAGALYAGVGLRQPQGLQVSGDEPHYLVMAQSLWRDHDLDLRDEYDGRGVGRVRARARCDRTGARRAPTAGRSRRTARACRCCWRPPTRLWAARAACC